MFEEEFEDINDWHDLYDIMLESGYTTTRDYEQLQICDWNDYDIAVSNDIREVMFDGLEWEEFRRNIDRIPRTEYDKYYKRLSPYNYIEATRRDFRETKRMLKRYMKENNMFLDAA